MYFNMGTISNWKLPGGGGGNHYQKVSDKQTKNKV